MARRLGVRALSQLVGASWLLITSAASAETPEKATKTVEARPLGRTFGPPTRFDVNVEGALGRLDREAGLVGFGRIRLGLLHIIESSTDPEASMIFVVLGVTADASNLSPMTLGIQTELIHISSGLWGQFGGLFDVTRAEPGWTAALGWNLFGVEAQRRRYAHEDSLPENDWALFGKVRVPVSLLIDTLTSKAR